MKSSKDSPVIINEHNLHTGITHMESKTIQSGYYWHKIIVENALNYPKFYVLRSIMSVVHPLDFIPVQYTIASNVSFLIKNCGAAITELCRLNLTVSHPDVEKKQARPFKLTIVLKFAYASELKIDMQSNIMKILHKRYNAKTQVLNLEAFYREKDLIEFCPLSQPKLLYFVLHLSRDFEIGSLRLGRNEIENIKTIEALYAEKILKRLNTIDLMHNKIESLDQLNVLKSFINIVDLRLHNNPVCDQYTEHDYIKTIKEYCPRLLRLDGIKLLSSKRNFLCDTNGKELIDRFLEHFFPLYDSPNRDALQELYHNEAMFSLTTQYHEGHRSTGFSNLNDYNKISRNIKQIADVSKNDKFLFRGNINIAKLFSILPKVEHDPYSFTVDLTYFTKKHVIFTVTGIFKEPGLALLDRDIFFSFARTFVLTTDTTSSEYNVTNDLLHITNATISQQTRAFKVVKVPKPQFVTIAHPQTEFQKEDIVNAIVKITTLKTEWAKKLLEECAYDFKKAVELFLSLFKLDKFPRFAFTDDFDLLCNYESASEIAITPSPTPTPTPSSTHSMGLSPVKNRNSILKNDSSSKQLDMHMKHTAEASTSEKQTSSDYITDKILLDALNMDIDVDKDVAVDKLEKASSLIISKYTYAVKYYRIIGKEYYRHKLFGSAQKFLKGAIANMPKQMADEIYNIFTLFEVEYHNLDAAEDMMEKVVINLQEKAIVFIDEKVAPINADFAHRIYKNVHLMKISVDLKSKLNEAYREFSKKFNINKENKGDIKPTISKATAFDDSVPFTNYDLRRIMLAKAKIIPKDCSDEEIRRLIRFTGSSNELLEVSKELTNKFKTNYYGIYKICQFLWNAGYDTEVKRIVTNLKGSIETQYLNNLVILFRIKSDLNQDNVEIALEKIHSHLRICKLDGVIFFFEDFCNEDPEFVKKTFENVLENKQYPPLKLQTVAMLYKAYCEKYNFVMPEIYSKGLTTIDTFHPNFVARAEFIKEFRHYYMGLPKGKMRPVQALDFIDKYEDDLDATIEGIRGLFYHNYLKRGREQRIRAFKKTKDNRVLIACSYFEAKYGSPNIGITVLKSLNETNNINVECALISCNARVKNYGLASDIFRIMVSDRNRILHTEVYDLIMEYHHDWKEDGFDIRQGL